MPKAKVIRIENSKLPLVSAVVTIDGGCIAEVALFRGGQHIDDDCGSQKVVMEFIQNFIAATNVKQVAKAFIALSAWEKGEKEYNESLAFITKSLNEAVPNAQKNDEEPGLAWVPWQREAVATPKTMS